MHLLEYDNKTGKISLPNAIKTLYGYLAILKNYKSNRKDIDDSIAAPEEVDTGCCLDDFEKAKTYWRNKEKEKLIIVRNRLLQEKQDMIQQLGTLFNNMFNIL